MKAESRPHINAIPSPTGVVIILMSRLENEEAPADDAPCVGFVFRLSVLPLVDEVGFVDVDVEVGLTTGGKTDSVFVPLLRPVPVPVPVLVELSAVIVLCVTPPPPVPAPPVVPEPMGTAVGEFSPVMTVVVATSPTWMTSVHSACPFPSWHSTPTCSVFPPSARLRSPRRGTRLRRASLHRFRVR